MPGVHVRTLSQLDCLSQEKGSLINIPGSYWLCHKKNIYKFIFRYHRTMKNTMQFSYGRELLKIIRRIIKCHPTQGQQFSTQHLLVTYNCTSWTRQDKMFALLKFEQQNDTATFSHAFVLTIKICTLLEQSLFDSKYPFVKESDVGSTFKDLNDVLGSEERTNEILMRNPDKTSSKKSAICHGKKTNKISKRSVIEDMLNETSETLIDSSLQNNIEKSTDIPESTDIRVENATTAIKEHFSNSIEFHDNTYKKKSVNRDTTFEDIERDLVGQRQKQIKTTKTKDEVTINKTNCIDHEMKCAEMQKQHQNIHKIKIFSSSKSLLTDAMKNTDDVKKWILLDKSNSDKSLIEEKRLSNNESNLDDNESIIDERIADSSNVLCQYFIEKESETTSNSSGAKQYDKICDLSNELQDKQRISMEADNKREKNNIYAKTYKARTQKNKESIRKSMTNNKTLRSSNITDLVMEGIMFTIRQDQDSVSVIEQKTKLEVDEVLENSEKVETEAGEKCLLNSSLLRLENLITMIDSPRDKNQQLTDSRNMISNNAYSMPRNSFTSNSVYNLNDNDYIDRTMSKSSIFNCDKHNTIERLTVDNSGSYQSTDFNIANTDDYSTNVTNRNVTKKRKREQMMETEKDIVPKVFQSMIPSSENTHLQITDALSNNINIEKAIKSVVSVKDCHNSLLPRTSSNSNELSGKETLTISKNTFGSKKSEETVPRVISNKTITIEQIPQALHKLLRQMHGFSPTSNNGTSLSHNVQKTESKTFIENMTTEVDVSTRGNCINSSAKMNKPLEVVVDSEEMKVNTNKTHVTNSKDDLEIGGNMFMRNTEKKNDKSSPTGSSQKYGSFRKLQDITEDFYYDLYEHNKDNVIRQSSRQKQKVLNNPKDMKNSEVRIDMLKFIHDMTEGAKVVVNRLNIGNKSSLL